MADLINARCGFQITNIKNWWRKASGGTKRELWGDWTGELHGPTSKPLENYLK